MRTAPSAVLLSVLMPLAVVALPVVSLPQASPHAVAPEFRSAAAARRAARPGPRRGAPRQRAGLVPGAPGGRPVGPRRRSRPTGGPGDPDRRAVLRPARRHLAGRDDRSTSPCWCAPTATPAGPAGPRWTPRPSPDAREARTARPGTEPLWVGDADGYQVRVDVRRGSLPRGLRVDLVDPGSSDADDEVGAPAARCSPPQAAAGQPAIFTRAQWGADESIRGNCSALQLDGPGRLRAPHGGRQRLLRRGGARRSCAAIYAYHVKANRWSDIGYNFLVDRFGRLWEGRYGGMDRAVVGAHTGGFNVDSFAVSAIGNYDKVAAPSVMVDSIARLMAWKLSLSHRNPNGTTVLTSSGRRHLEVPRGPEGPVQRRVRAPGRRQHVVPGHQPLRAAGRRSAR